MTRKRIPLADKTRSFTNSLQRRTVSEVTRNLFKKDIPQNENSRILKSVIKSFNSSVPVHRGIKWGKISKPCRPKHHISTKHLIEELDGKRSFKQAKAQEPAKRSNGILTGQLSKQMDKINTMSAILNYSQPLRKERVIDKDAVVVAEIKKMSSTFMLVTLDDGETVGLICFQKNWVKIKPGNSIVLGDSSFQVDISGKPIQCYYRWYKVVATK